MSANRFSSIAIATAVMATACASTRVQPEPPDAKPTHLYVWAAATDTTRGSFLGVVDLERNALVRVVPAGTPSRGAHHTEYEVGADNHLFANAFGSGRTVLFDLRNPAEPRLVSSLGDVGPYSHPHSYARLPNGNVMATFQWKVGGALPGGLVELNKQGQPVRWASAATAEADSLQIVPYSLVVLPELDRMVSTSTHMIEDIGVHVQIWRLSDLKLLHTLPVPLAGEHGDHAVHTADHHKLPGEPRLLADGRTVMFGTFTCGLYRVTGLDATPAVSFVSGFPGENCAVPVVIGKYWIQTVPALHALVALDVSDPARPIEASRLVFPDHVAPHWLAADASGRYLVTSSSSKKDPTLHLVYFDPATGTLKRSGDAPIVDFSRVQWPDGFEGGAVPHGVVFARPSN